MSPPALRSAFRLAAVATTAAALAGCVSLLPKAEPSQLYSFVPTQAEAAAPAPAVPPRGLVLTALTFPQAATGDAVLTRTGAQAAYVQGARWVAPAVVLFREAVERAFDRDPQARLLTRGDVGGAVAVLRLDVRDFEVRYPAPEATPTVVISLQARLTRPNGLVVDQRAFEVQQPASENRVGPIVAAFEQATGSVLSQTTAWAGAAAAAVPPPGSSSAAAAAPQSTSTTTRRSATSTTTVPPAR